MAEMLNNLDAPSDAELISRVRGGDADAYGLLFARHVDAARRLARQLVRGPDSDDLVSDAFTKVMGALQRGGGPDIAFRAYLLTAVRRLHVDRVRAQARLTPSEDLSEFDPGVPFQDTVVEQFESGAAARAFASLPERWQMVLWHLEVERQKPAEIAPLLGMTANSVSALAYRAREGLRQAFLSAHLAEAEDADCCWVIEHLGAHVRKGLSKRDSGKVETHLEGCRSCSAMYLELEEVNSDLSGLIAPLLLGGLAAGYLGATGSGVAAGGVVALLDRAKDFVLANIVPVAAGTTAAGVATAVVVAGGVGSGGRSQDPDVSAPPAASVSNEPASAELGSDSGASNAASTDRRTQGPEDGTQGKQGTTDKPGARPSPSGPPSDPGSSSSNHPGPISAPPTGTPPAGPSGAATTPPQAQQPTQPPSQPPSPTPKPSPTQPPESQGNDVALGLNGSVIGKGVGRVHAHVSNLPTSSGSTPLQFTISFSDSRVKLQSIPQGCSNAGSNTVSCSGTKGASWNGVFDSDMTALLPGESVTITLSVTASGVDDPDSSNNTSSVKLTRTGAGRLLSRR